MKIALSGATGFVGWHTQVAAHTRSDLEIVPLGRAAFEDPALMRTALSESDAVIHLAGVNRAATEDEIRETNTWLATQLAAGISQNDRPIPLVYGNSIHSAGHTVFGAAKQHAGEILSAACRSNSSPFVDVILPNLFGEHGRPFYNSFVSTFCHQLASGEKPAIDVDRELPLLHVQRAVAVLLDLTHSPGNRRIELSAPITSVGDVLLQLQSIRDNYLTGDLPDLSEPFTRDLFNTYRSYTIDNHWPIYPKVNTDERGELFETVRARGGEAQVFFSTTRPGYTRGQHFHLHKVERFLVLRGSARIRLRKLLSDEVLEFDVSGTNPAIIDMPTMWVHSITNTGSSELVTLFYADQIFDADKPDTYPEDV